ncbi:MAG: glutamate racemase, partial [Bacteroidales bacterium]|nr:glutamate racemase [Bacteroidales bacterium]
MQKNQPIGVFDSGIGGLTVLKSLQELMPQENFVYLGDNKNAPYGNKASEEIINLSNKCTEFLISKSAKIIVVACNTATGTAI